MSSGRDNIVVHLVPTTWGRGSPSAVRIAAGGVFGGLVVLLAAFARVATGGQDPRTLLVGLGVAVIVIGLLVGYGYLRLHNATIYLDDNRVGVTNALKKRSQVPTEQVLRFRRTTDSTTSSAQKPKAVLLIETKNGRHVLRFSGADRLEPGGVERIAEAIGVPIEGSW